MGSAGKSKNTHKKGRKTKLHKQGVRKIFHTRHIDQARPLNVVALHGGAAPGCLQRSPPSPQVWEDVRKVDGVHNGKVGPLGTTDRCRRRRCRHLLPAGCCRLLPSAAPGCCHSWPHVAAAAAAIAAACSFPASWLLVISGPCPPHCSHTHPMHRRVALDEDLPAHGQHFCIACTRYFISAKALEDHEGTRPHRRCVFGLGDVGVSVAGALGRRGCEVGPAMQLCTAGRCRVNEMRS